ncbi:MAG TPA: class I adenylate-forming enzyme family protein, partial [Pyrinomonadaceae bacterium]|nr:class I adenylate-forming enzyme family protein [Pyrinomonadaceae bacterium]
MSEQFENIDALLRARVVTAPAKGFLFSEADGRRFSYSEFQQAVNRTAAMLSSRGLVKGDVVSLLMPNSAEYIIAYFACWRIGALAGPVNSLLKEHEIEFVMNNSEAKAILVNSDFQPIVEKIKNQLPHLRSIINFDDETQPRLQTTDRQGGSLSRDAFPNGRASDTISRDDNAIIIYTSGTTGRPKGCLLTH